MSNILWYPETIKATVLTDVLNWKTIEKSYKDLYERFGKRALLATNHEKLFNEFIRETYELKRAQKNINEIMFNESMYLRYRILRDVVSKVPIDKSYVKLRETMGDIKYLEFYFCYYRFSDGERELDYNRSEDPKPLAFSDLPTDVIEKILEKSDIQSRYVLRSVSRSLQHLVDSSKLVIEKITINGESCPLLTNIGGFEKSFYGQYRWWPGRPIGRITYLENAACRHLSTFIRNPKLQLGTLDLNIDDDTIDNKFVADLFKSLTNQFHVRNLKLKIPCQEMLTVFIRCLKPRILRKIEIGWDNKKSMNIHGLLESEQWKQAEEVIITNSVYCDIAHFFRFKTFDICLTSPFKESILQLRNEISKSSNFEWCRFRTNSELDFIKWPSNLEIRSDLGLKKQIHNNMEYFVYNIPNSTKTLVFSFFDNEIFIKKYSFTAGL